MDLDSLIGAILSIVMIAIVLGAAITIVNRVLKFKETIIENAAQAAADYAAKTERLEQRVRVLERIATVRGADIAAQIEDLRDEPVDNGRLQ